METFTGKECIFMSLEDIRKRIDAIDKQLLPLFIERMECASEVAKEKHKQNLPVFNAQRENEILARVAQNAGDFAPEAKMLYTTLMALNRSRQHKLLNSGVVQQRGLQGSYPRDRVSIFRIAQNQPSLPVLLYPNSILFT